VQFDGEHARTGGDQCCGQRPTAGADVEDKVARLDSGVRNDPCGPLVNERMPTP
jgi:hypothetical protein